MGFLKRLGHFVLKLAGEDVDQGVIHTSNQLSERLKEEVYEMEMHQFSASNSEYRMQWSAIGPVYNTYYHMIESMIIGEMKILREKYLYVAHQLSPTDYGGTICRIIIKPHGTKKTYQAEISINVSIVVNGQVECIICRELPENANMSLLDKGSVFMFDGDNNLAPMSSRMLSSANMMMAIHNIMKDIDDELTILLTSS